MNILFLPFHINAIWAHHVISLKTSVFYQTVHLTLAGSCEDPVRQHVNYVHEMEAPELGSVPDSLTHGSLRSLVSCFELPDVVLAYGCVCAIVL